jgi:hypothetical protein
MHIQFDTQDLRSNETRGLIAFLHSLLPVNEQNNLTPAAGLGSAALSPKTEQQTIFGVPVQATPPDAPTPSAAEPTPINEPATRKRRTKAEIAADEAAQKSAADGRPEIPQQITAADPVVQAQQSIPDPRPAPGAVTGPVTESKPITKEILTELANGYIARHSMEAAFAILKTTGCQRLNEAMAMEPAKLAELAEKFRG